MALEIIRNDITKVKADAIVNTANPKPIIGGGTDTAIYRAAGEEQMLSERKKIGDIARGEVAVTSAYNLKAKYVIHTVGPIWQDGQHGELDVLASCYRKSLEKAVELGCKSIAFPMISTGIYGFPKDKALQIALSTIQSFLINHKLKVTLVVFSAEAFELSGNIFDEIQSFIDENYIEDALAEEYGVYYRDERNIPKEMRREGLGNHKGAEPIDFDNLFKDDEKTFQEKLFELIHERGVKESYVYNSIHMSRAFFSKVRWDRYYQPTKKTVFAIAITLNLKIDETVDLLTRAGLAFSKSSKLDVIVEACIRNGLYDFEEIDLVLIKNNLDTLRKYN